VRIFNISYLGLSAKVHQIAETRKGHPPTFAGVSGRTVDVAVVTPITSGMAVAYALAPAPSAEFGAPSP
jgi:hypothetical protein